MPESPEDSGSIKGELEKLNPDRLEEEPIGYGLSAWKFTKIIPDSAGEIDKIEDALNAIPRVQSVETMMVTRRLG